MLYDILVVIHYPLARIQNENHSLSISGYESCNHGRPAHSQDLLTREVNLNLTSFCTQNQ